jgi:hypothetical protein
MDVAIKKHMSPPPEPQPIANGLPQQPTNIDQRVKAYLDKCESAVSGQGGHPTTYRVACQVINGFGLSRLQAIDALRYYGRKCDPPWSDRELQHKVDEAFKAQHNKPTGHLLNIPEAELKFSKELKRDYAEVQSGDEYPEVNWEEPAEGARASRFTQQAIYPKDSILGDFVDYARKQTEGAEAYIIGTILPVAGAILGRQVFIYFGAKKLYPNVFNMLAGKAGDRKSYTIDLGAAVRRECLPNNAFLPTSLSPETLFDEYDLQCSGREDKLWIVDDANIVLSDWKKSCNGERVASRFLSLYDCKSLTESFRRNKKETADKVARREIPETSTNILFGATFNAACFQGQSQRAGFDRRFLYYVAEGHERLITWPERNDLEPLIIEFSRLKTLHGEIQLSADARKLWNSYQEQNRKIIDETDSNREAELSRLGTAPTHVLKIATIFETSRAAYFQRPFRFIEDTTLELAIAHVDECLRSAAFLDSLANRAAIINQAESVLARIRLLPM